MKNLKPILKIVGSVGIAFWIACCFMGMYFATDGNTMIALPITLLIGVVLFLSYFLMLKMQDKETRNTDAKRAKTMEIVWLCVYLAGMLVSAYYVNHLVKTYDQRPNIRTQANNAMGELSITFSQKEGVDKSYREWVSEELGHYQLYVEAHPDQFTGDPENLWIDFEDKLIYQDYENLERKVNSCLQQVKATVVDNWYLPTLLRRLNELSQKEEWEQQVVEISKRADYTEGIDPYQPVSFHNCEGITDGLTTASFSFPVVSIIIMVALQLIILLAYLLSLKSGGNRDKIQTSDTGALRSWGKNN